VRPCAHTLVGSGITHKHWNRLGEAMHLP